jgi:hypothetical protein
MLATKTPTTPLQQIDHLPVNVLNLARRIRQITQQEGDGRYVFEIIALDGRLLLTVREVQRMENLG